MKPFAAILLAALGLVLASPASGAQKCVAPPGTAAIEQYCETVPSVSGNQSTGSGIAPSQNGSTGVSPSTADQIAASIGNEAAQSISGAAPRPAQKGRERAKPVTRAAGRAPAGTESNPLTAVASAAGTGAEVGGPLIYGLLGLTLLLASIGWARFRRAGS